MERLTKKINDFWATNNKANVYYIDKNESVFIGNAIDRLAEFEDFMEEQDCPNLQTLKDTLYQANLQLYKMNNLEQENQALKNRWQKLKELLEKDMNDNQKEYDESFLSAFQNYSATENWVLDRMEELEAGGEKCQKK